MQSDSGETSAPETEDQAKTASLAQRLDRIEANLAVLADVELSKSRQKPERLARHVSLFENWWGVRLFLSVGSIVALIAFGLSLWAYYEERSVRAEEREARKQESIFRRQAQISTAWSTLLTPVGGNTGKAEALDILLASGARLVGVDLSCRNIGSYANGTCDNPAIFDFGLRLEGEGRDIDFENVTFAGNEIYGLSVTGGAFDNVDFTGVKARYWHLEDVLLYDLFELEGLHCENCIIRDMYLDWRNIRQFRSAYFGGSIVVFPKNADVDTENGRSRVIFADQTLPANAEQNHTRMLSWNMDIEEPALFVRASVPTPEDGGPELLTEPGINRIFWDLYSSVQICARVDTIVENKLPSPDGRGPDEFRIAWADWADRSELAEELGNDRSICGFDLNDPLVRATFLSHVRKTFAWDSFHTLNENGEAALIALECEGDNAIVPKPEQDLSPVAENERIPVEPSPCIMLDGAGN